MLVEILQVAHVVNLHAVVRAAQLTRIGEQAFEHLRSAIPGMRRSVIEDCVNPPSERNATPLRHQRQLPVQVVGPGIRFAVTNIGAALRSDQIRRDTKSNLTIEAAPAMVVARFVFG
jgi:hypothetical protein